MAKYEDKIKSIDKEAQEILDAARKKAKKQEADILAEAREEANRIVDRANREIELEKKKALEDMKTEIVSIASLMAEKASRSNVSRDRFGSKRSRCWRLMKKAHGFV